MSRPLDYDELCLLAEITELGYESPVMLRAALMK
jgi:hypothetical protein